MNIGSLTPVIKKTALKKIKKLKVLLMYTLPGLLFKGYQFSSNGRIMLKFNLKKLIQFQDATRGSMYSFSFVFLFRLYKIHQSLIFAHSLQHIVQNLKLTLCLFYITYFVFCFDKLKKYDTVIFVSLFENCTIVFKKMSPDVCRQSKRLLCFTGITVCYSTLKHGTISSILK